MLYTALRSKRSGTERTLDTMNCIWKVFSIEGRNNEDYVSLEFLVILVPHKGLPASCKIFRIDTIFRRESGSIAYYLQLKGFLKV